MEIQIMIKAENIWKVYSQMGEPLEVLTGLKLDLSPGKRVGIVGASGAGKSTLLHILGGLDKPDRGEVWLEGENFYSHSEGKRSALRGKSVGFVFQFYHLLPELTALENVSLPAWIQRLSRAESRGLAVGALERVGLASKGGQLPSELSGGEQQRVAIARACILSPKLILADEPTGNLDLKTGEGVFNYLLEVVAASGGSLVMATHNRELAQKLDEVYELKNGKLELAQ